MPRPALRSLAFTALCVASCATPEARPERKPFLPYQLAPEPHASSAPPPSVRARESAEPGGAPAMRIDATLIGFAVEQRSSRATHPHGQPMPPAVRSAWSQMLGEVDHLLRQPARQTVPLDVVRARVALDAELDMDHQHYLSLPDGLPAAVKARGLALDQRLAEIRKLSNVATPAAARLLWPIEPVIVTSLFGMRADPIRGDDRDHQGIDLKAEKGQLVQAAAAGTVIRAGPAGGYGLHVEIEHSGGWVTTYSHLSTILVTEGAHVPTHGPVGLAGSTGHSTGPHLHFEVWRDGLVVDPLGELSDTAVAVPGFIYSARP